MRKVYEKLVASSTKEEFDNILGEYSYDLIMGLPTVIDGIPEYKDAFTVSQKFLELYDINESNEDTVTKEKLRGFGLGFDEWICRPELVPDAVRAIAFSFHLKSIEDPTHEEVMKRIQSFINITFSEAKNLMIDNGLKPEAERATDNAIISKTIAYPAHIIINLCGSEEKFKNIPIVELLSNATKVDLVTEFINNPKIVAEREFTKLMNEMNELISKIITSHETGEGNNN